MRSLKGDNMAIKARGQISLSVVVDVQATYRYYLLQSSTLAKPSKPTSYAPPTIWDDTEPMYTDGSTNSLYFVDCTVFCDGTFAYSEVSLSSSYEAAKAAYNKAQNAQNTADAAQDAVDNMEIGGRNLLVASKVNIVDSAEYKISTVHFGVKPIEGETYTLSLKGRLGNGKTAFCAYNSGDLVLFGQLSARGNGIFAYTGVWHVANADNTHLNIYTLNSDTSAASSIEWVKLEKGNKATDWTPAPEDVDDAVNDAKDTANNAHELVTSAQLSVDQLKNTISTLVQGANGESLMTQTDTGWSFNFAGFQQALNDAASNIHDLSIDSSELSGKIDTMHQSIADLGVYTDYIKFGVDNGKPCIILGETDSAFKVVITNTDIRFMEGTTTPASISNETLNIEKAAINAELRQGGFAWIARSNGNYGLVWRG